MRINSDVLFDNANKCFELGSDAHTPFEQQEIYLEKGTKFRDAAINEAIREFDANTTRINQANDKIVAVNAKLKARLDGLNSAADTIGAVSDLAGILDELLGIVV
jgi:hypothetical protein